MKEITYHESLSIDDRVYIDVRSPLEFAEDHISGSINIPLFGDDERKEVGTIYRMAGRDTAIERGTEIVGEKLRELVKSFLPYRERSIVLLCARGGMRSRSLGSLLDSLGLRVFKLDHGYKGYRRHVLERLKIITAPATLFVLQGLTGSGKTDIIRNFPWSIDLEEMAGHRSSVFGSIGIVQKSQKRFESLLLDRLRDLQGAPYCLIEGESRKIGDLHIPETLYGLMAVSPVIYLDTPMERRVDIIFDEYHPHCDDRNIPAIVESLFPKLGRGTVDHLLELYRAGHIREFIRIMLEKYYDPLYRHSLQRKEFIATVHNTSTAGAIDELKERMAAYCSQHKDPAHL
ncbi:MAG: tRNA 2-selenouridine(34) synthase MnmH [Spirochaetes bacterium]|nr:tRNA 2-selenouridine(34) synthase MnmH [Spirochaetota bacterium]